MIIIIDDNRYNQMSENYKTDFTKELLRYTNKVKWIKNINNSNLNEILSVASCILIHDSVEEKDIKDRLIASLRLSNKIPYCIFSNGFTATVLNENSITSIKKDRLYNNLLVFIQAFIGSGKPDLRLLALGAKYDLEKGALLQDRLISNVLLVHRQDFHYETAFPSGSQAYKDLRELVYLSDPKLDFSAFEETFNQSSTTAEILRKEIIRMTLQIKKKYE
jgi:hypothetical protein